MQLKDYLMVLRNSWLLVLLVGLVGALGGAGLSFIQSQPARYEASTILYVSVRDVNNAEGIPEMNANANRGTMASYATLATTEIVLSPVIDQLDLEMTVAGLAGSVQATTPVNQSVITVTVTDAEQQRVAEIANAIGASLTSVINEIEGTEHYEQELVKVTTVQSAVQPAGPVVGGYSINVVAGVILGLAVGYLIALGREVSRRPRFKQLDAE